MFELDNLRWNDIVDVLLVSVMLWIAIHWIRQTRSRLALLGVGILLIVYSLARLLELRVSTWLLQGFLATLVIVIVVVFQHDLRRLFEQIGGYGYRRKSHQPERDTIGVLVSVAHQLAAARVGALIVLPGVTPIEAYLESGVGLEGLVSEPLLLSLFDPSSPGHDGAVILAGDRISHFGAHLPLSSNDDQLQGRGTRHAAGLGLTERTDALCIVVSEESGTISVAIEGRLATKDGPAVLRRALHDHFGRHATEDRTGFWRAIRPGWSEAGAALVLSSVLWFALASAGEVEIVTAAKVRVVNIPTGYVLEGVRPAEVEVTLVAPRASGIGSDSQIEARIDALSVGFGRRTFEVGARQVRAPPGARVLSVEPSSVLVIVREDR